MPFQVQRKSSVTWLQCFDGKTFATKQKLLDFVTEQIVIESRNKGLVESYTKAHNDQWQLKCAKCHTVTSIDRSNFMVHMTGGPNCKNADCYATHAEYPEHKFPTWLINSRLTSLVINFDDMNITTSDGCCIIDQVASIKTLA